MMAMVPDEPALVQVMRSVHRVWYPFTIRTIVYKHTTAGECNNFFIALGASYVAHTSSSVLLQWDCDSKIASLRNSSYIWQDTACWNTTASSAFNNGSLLQSLSLTITATNSKVTVAFDAADCSDLSVFASDLKLNTITPYLWFGTFARTDDDNVTEAAADADLQPVVARFGNMFYTQFYSEFDGLNQLIWQRKPELGDDDEVAVMYDGGDTIVAGNSYEFQLPFVIETGIKRPWNKENDDDDDDDDDATTTTLMYGRYAHFIAIGADTYENALRANVVQIVYDDVVEQRMVYTRDAIYVDSTACKWAYYGKTFAVRIVIYVDSTACKWAHYGKTFAVRIVIDANLISVRDEFCEHTLYARHDLLSTAHNQTLMAMGMIDGGDDDEFIAFQYVEVYQLPMAYYDQLLPPITSNITLSDARSVTDIYGEAVARLQFLGYDLLYWILLGVIVLVLFICLYCLIAWCLHWCPFRRSDADKKPYAQPKVVKEDEKLVYGGPVAGNKGHHALASSLPHAAPTGKQKKKAVDAIGMEDERFETGQIFHSSYDEKPNVIANSDNEEDGDDDNMFHMKGDRLQAPIMRPMQVRNAGGAAPAVNVNVNVNAVSSNRDFLQYDTAELDDAEPGDGDEDERNAMLQRQLYLQRQFLQTMSNSRQQQEVLQRLPPQQRLDYVQKQMALYVDSMQWTLKDLSPEMLNKMMQSNQTNANANGNVMVAGRAEGTEEFNANNLDTHAAMNDMMAGVSARRFDAQCDSWTGTSTAAAAASTDCDCAAV